MTPKTRQKPAAAKTTARQIRTQRAALGIPEPGQSLRAWLRFQLQDRVNPETEKPYTQADVARLAGASEARVSRVYVGDAIEGKLSAEIRRVTAAILEIPAAVIFRIPKEE